MVQNAWVKAKPEKRIEETRRNIKEVEKQMEAFVVRQDNEAFKHLTHIPGIGKKTAIALLAVTGGMKSFDSAGQMCSCFGLCPRIYDSGTSVKGKAGICKTGMASIRKLLYMYVLSAKKYSKACRELYERLLALGKKKKLALIAVANKLIRQCFSIIKNSCEYVDDFCVKKPCAR
jgi:transposase